MKLRKKSYRPPPYKSVVVWFYDGNHADYVKDVRKQTGVSDIDEHPSAGRTLTHDSGDGRYCYVWLEKGQDAASLAHECLHVMTELAFKVGMRLQHDNDEPFAYSLEHMLRFAMGFYGMKRKTAP